MVLFQRRHENKKANHIWNQVMQSDLMCYKAQSDNEENVQVEIDPFDGCCNYCLSFIDKFYSMKEVIDKPPHNSNKCTHEYGCRCFYLRKTIRQPT